MWDSGTVNGKGMMYETISSVFLWCNCLFGPCIFTIVNVKQRPTILTMSYATMAHALHVSSCISSTYLHGIQIFNYNNMVTFTEHSPVGLVGNDTAMVTFLNPCIRGLSW